MAESAANVLQDNNDDNEFTGLLGMRLDIEFDEDVVLPETVSLEMAFLSSFPSSVASGSAKAFPARQDPYTVYPAPGEQNRPRGRKDLMYLLGLRKLPLLCPLGTYVRSRNRWGENSIMLLHHEQSHGEQNHGLTTSLDRRSKDSQLSNLMKRWKNQC